MPPSQVKNADKLVFNFSDEAVQPVDITEVLVRIREVQKMVKFIVMDMDSPFNAIICRTWLRMMKAVASPYHQKLKFPSKEGSVRGKQKDARHCFGLVMQSALAKKHSTELAESLPTEGNKSKKDKADEMKDL